MTTRPQTFLQDLIHFTTCLADLAPIATDANLMMPLPQLQSVVKTLRDPHLPCILVHRDAARAAMRLMPRPTAQQRDHAFQPPSGRCYIEFTDPVDLPSLPADSTDQARALLIHTHPAQLYAVTAFTATSDWDYSTYTGAVGQISAMYDLSTGTAYANPRDLTRTATPSAIPEELTKNRLVPCGHGRWKPGLYENNAVIYAEFAVSLLCYLQHSQRPTETLRSHDYHRWTYLAPPQTAHTASRRRPGSQP